MGNGIAFGSKGKDAGNSKYYNELKETIETRGFNAGYGNIRLAIIKGLTAEYYGLTDSEAGDIYERLWQAYLRERR